MMTFKAMPSKQLLDEYERAAKVDNKNRLEKIRQEVEARLIK